MNQLLVRVLVAAQQTGNSSAMQAFAAILFCSMDVASTGVLIASKRMGYLVRAMTATLACVAVYYWRLKPAAGHSLSGVWWGLVLFFAARSLQSAAGMLQTYLPRLDKRTHTSQVSSS